jgi:hypothetical protein
VTGPSNEGRRPRPPMPIQRPSPLARHVGHIGGTIFFDGDVRFDDDGQLGPPVERHDLRRHPPRSGFQGVVSAQGTCTIHERFNLSGPVVCGSIQLPYESDGWPTYYAFPSLSELVDG